MTKSWSLETAVEVFIAGLWSAPFYWRYLLQAKLIAEAMPEHAFIPYSDQSSRTCAICGFNDYIIDKSLKWFNSFTNGASLDGEPITTVLTLQEIAKSR